MDREAISNAVHALFVGITWGDDQRGFAYTGQKLHGWIDCPAQPALYTVEHNETHQQATRMPTFKALEFLLVIYQNTGSIPGNTVPPKVENNLILDAISSAIAPTPGFETQTLGGLAHHVFIEGSIFKDSGDLDGQGVMTIPIKVLVP